MQTHIGTWLSVQNHLKYTPGYLAQNDFEISVTQRLYALGLHFGDDAGLSLGLGLARFFLHKQVWYGVAALVIVVCGCTALASTNRVFTFTCKCQCGRALQDSKESMWMQPDTYVHKT